jgi:arsenite-transporting ATPase
MGYKTIVLSTDTAHSLGDSFDTTLGNGLQPIVSNLWAQETEISQTVEENWGRIQKWATALMEWRGMGEVAATEMAILPGMEELANLLYIVHYDKYDVIIVDCAPTGDTLRLLSFPDVLRWWMEKMFPIGRKAAGLIRPFVKPFSNMPLPEAEVFNAAEDLFAELDQIHTLFSNWEKSSVRLVLNAEKMAIKETQRTFTYLNLYGYLTDLIVCNRLIPDEVEDRYFDSWKESQGRYYQLIEECFAPIPILNIPLLHQEVVGIPALNAMAEALFGNEDPTKLFFRGRAHGVKKEDDHYILSIPLPFLAKEDISLTKSGDELIVHAGRHRRNIILPHILIGLEVQGAKFEGDELHIRFEERKAN